MDRLQIETVELDEQIWQKWVEKGKLREQVRKRRWRIIGGVVGGNGHFFLQVAGHPHYGLPWGQDRLVPFFLATLAVRQQSRTVIFDSAAEMLDTFGLQQGGSQYRRLVASFLRVFGATIFFGTDVQRRHAAVVNQARFNFMSEARIWFARDPSQEGLPHVGQNVVVLSEEFHQELVASDSGGPECRESSVVVTSRL